MGGSSSSASSNETSTQNTDKRLVVSDQGIGLSSDSSTVNITMSDQGAIKGAEQIARDALTSSNVNNAMVGANLDTLIRSTSSGLKLLSDQSGANVEASMGGFRSLLGSTDNALVGLFNLADKALTGGFDTVDRSLTAISASQDAAKGSLDNRTITILGISAAVVVGAFAMRKK